MRYRARPDAIITDNMMHGMSGLELATQVRDVDAQMPILIVSGIPIDAALPPRVAFLAKPYSHAALVASIDGLVSASDDVAQSSARV